MSLGENVVIMIVNLMTSTVLDYNICYCT